MRRYLVGEVGGNPGWGLGILQAWGCKHRTSAMNLFQRLVERPDTAEAFVFDRRTGQLVARRTKSTPEQDSEFVRQFIR